MKTLKLLGWIYVACSLMLLVIIAVFTFLDKIPLSHTLLYGIVWSDALIIALITRKEHPEDFIRTLFIAFIFFILFIAALLLEYA